MGLMWSLLLLITFFIFYRESYQHLTGILGKFTSILSKFTGVFSKFINILYNSKVISVWTNLLAFFFSKKVTIILLKMLVNTLIYQRFLFISIFSNTLVSKSFFILFFHKVTNVLLKMLVSKSILSFFLSRKLLAYC